ncbi:MAG TPA: hypothetical protein VIL85_18205 [Thermomicrobiales bacterium]
MRQELIRPSLLRTWNWRIAVHSRPFWFSAALFITLRIVYSGIAFIASTFPSLVQPYTALGTPVGVSREAAALIHMHMEGSRFGLLGVWQRWDAAWFEQIATVNYQPADPAVAFPPLFPLLMHVVGRAFGGNFTLGGLVVSGIAYVVAMVGLYKLVCDDWDEVIAQRTVLYLSLFPTAFFLFAPYAEAVFLASSVWSFYFARRHAWIAAALTAGLAALTRSPGILLAAPLAWESFRYWRSDWRRWPALLAPLVPLGCFLVYSVYCRIFTGWSYFDGVATWGTKTIPPWTAVIRSFQFILVEQNPLEALNLALLLFFAGLTLYGLRKLPFSYLLYTSVQLFLIGARYSNFSPLMSASRYFVVVFPLFIMLAIALQRRPAHYLWLAMSSILSLELFAVYLWGAFVA